MKKKLTKVLSVIVLCCLLVLGVTNFGVPVKVSVAADPAAGTKFASSPLKNFNSGEVSVASVSADYKISEQEINGFGIWDKSVKISFDYRLVSGTAGTIGLNFKTADADGADLTSVNVNFILTPSSASKNFSTLIRFTEDKNDNIVSVEYDGRTDFTAKADIKRLDSPSYFFDSFSFSVVRNGGSGQIALNNIILGDPAFLMANDMESNSHFTSNKVNYIDDVSYPFSEYYKMSAIDWSGNLTHTHVSGEGIGGSRAVRYQTTGMSNRVAVRLPAPNNPADIPKMELGKQYEFKFNFKTNGNYRPRLDLRIDIPDGNWKGVENGSSGAGQIDMQSDLYHSPIKGWGWDTFTFTLSYYKTGANYYLDSVIKFTNFAESKSELRLSATSTNALTTHMDICFVIYLQENFSLGIPVSAGDLDFFVDDVTMQETMDEYVEPARTNLLSSGTSSNQALTAAVRNDMLKYDGAAKKSGSGLYEVMGQINLAGATTANMELALQFVGGTKTYTVVLSQFAPLPAQTRLFYASFAVSSTTKGMVTVYTGFGETGFIDTVSAVNLVVRQAGGSGRTFTVSNMTLCKNGDYFTGEETIHSMKISGVNPFAEPSLSESQKNGGRDNAVQHVNLTNLKISGLPSVLNKGEIIAAGYQTDIAGSPFNRLKTLVESKGYEFAEGYLIKSSDPLAVLTDYITVTVTPLATVSSSNAAIVYIGIDGKLYHVKDLSYAGGAFMFKTMDIGYYALIKTGEEPETYGITYANLSGGSHTNPETYVSSAGVPSFSAPSGRAGYAGSWNTTNIPAGTTGTVTVTAIWTPITYTIAYNNLSGGSHSNPASYNIETETITFAAPSGKAGYNGSWDTVSITKGSTGNKTVTAIWTPITYTIAYNNLSGGTHSNPSSYNVETETINLTPPAGRSGFVGSWDIQIIPKGSTGNRVITAVWTPDSPDAYAIIYANLLGGSHANQGAYLTEEGVPSFSPPAGRAGYTGAWDKMNIPAGTEGAVTVTAIWTPITYAIAYNNLQGGLHANPATYTVEDQITFTAPSGLQGYTGSWDITGIPKGSTGNKTITAVWTPDGQSATFIIIYENLLGGAHINPEVYSSANGVSSFSGPVGREGYIGSWDTASIPAGSTGTITITAIWTPVVYTITYVNLLNGMHSNNVHSYTVETETITFTAPGDRKGYTGSWDTQSIPKGSTGNKIITAVWTLAEDPPPKDDKRKSRGCGSGGIDLGTAAPLLLFAPLILFVRKKTAGRSGK